MRVKLTGMNLRGLVSFVLLPRVGHVSGKTTRKQRLKK